jgi:hypothetical protein
LRAVDRAGTYLSLAALASLAAVVWAAAVLPRLSGNAATASALLLVVAPYVSVGLALVTLFSSDAAASPRLYRADLLGAAAGTLAAVPILNLSGDVNGILTASLLLALAGTVAHTSGGRRAPALTTLLIGVILVANVATGWLLPDMTRLPADKPIADALDGGQLLRTEWDAFARTDLVAPGDGGPYRIYVDGAAASVMPPAQDNDFLWRDIGLFPFATEQPERVFIIGPGGGLDVWFGLQSEASEIVAVEVNAASVEIVEAEAAYNGALYQQDPVRVVVDEGRSLLRRDGSRYDLIFISQLVTQAAERSGYALVENSSFTVEAFVDYLDHLTEAGQIAVKLYDEPTLTRALATALAAWRTRGLSDTEALQRIIVLLDDSREPAIPLLLVRNAPFSRDDALSIGAVALDVGFTPLFLPGVLAQPPLDAVVAGEQSFGDIVANATTDIAPTTDDQPFFYQFERGVPEALRPLLWILAGVVAAGGLVLLWAQRNVRPLTARWSPLYFAGLGVGFITIEVALIQQTRLFLGHPTLAITAVLATLFVGGGIGSGLAGRLTGSAEDHLLAWPSFLVVLLTLLWIGLWPRLNEQFLATEQTLRLTVVIASLLPLAFVMGMPFPLGLRAVGAAGDRHIALAWAVNGVMTVAGSAAAVTIAILAGFSRVLLLGAAAYLLVALVALVLARVDAPNPNPPLEVSSNVDSAQVDVDGQSRAPA